MAKKPAALFNGACSSLLDPRSVQDLQRYLEDGSGLKGSVIIKAHDPGAFILDNIIYMG